MRNLLSKLILPCPEGLNNAVLHKKLNPKLLLAGLYCQQIRRLFLFEVSHIVARLDGILNIREETKEEPRIQKMLCWNLTQLAFAANFSTAASSRWINYFGPGNSTDILCIGCNRCVEQCRIFDKNQYNLVFYFVLFVCFLSRANAESCSIVIRANGRDKTAQRIRTDNVGFS